MSFLVEGLDVVMHLDSYVIILFHYSIIIFAVAPELVGLTGVQVSAAPVTGIKRRDVVRTAVSVHTEYC